MEIWRDIKDYEGLYQVSNLGNIKSLKRTITYQNGKVIHLKEKILKPKLCNSYAYIELSKNNKAKHFYIHRLVAQEFIKDYNKKLEINHKDFDRSNNKLENLECITKYENWKYSYDKGRIPIPPPQKPKKIICLNDGKIFNSIKEAGKYYNINYSMICNQLKGRTKKVHNKIFEYKYRIEIEEVF